MPKSNTINILYGYINKHKNKNIYFNLLLINNLTKDISINKHILYSLRFKSELLKQNRERLIAIRSRRFWIGINILSLVC